jgi:hypothetical protein
LSVPGQLELVKHRREKVRLTLGFRGTQFVESVSIVLCERNSLFDTSDEIRVTDEVSSEDDDRVLVLLSGRNCVLLLESSGDEERSRSPDVVLQRNDTLESVLRPRLGIEEEEN